MRKNFLTILLLFSYAITFGQAKSKHYDEILFEKGLALQELVNNELDTDEGSEDSIYVEYSKEIKESILEKAQNYYKELIKDYPGSKYLFRTYNNEAFIALQLNNRAEAIGLFQEILKSNADDKEKGGIGSGIMGEPYANYKNRAAKEIAELYIADSNYTLALTYLELTKKYQYQHFCGNEFAADALYIAEQYARCYIGLKDFGKALDFLLPYILENGLASNSSIVHLAFNTLMLNYGKDELKVKFEEAFKNYKVEKVKEYRQEYTKYFIYYLERKIEIPLWKIDFMYNGEIDKGIEALYKESQFYKLLSI
ncbi:hypothetical protein F0919_14860 [Taibaiella lutea]|uniref:Tetratricopeptide repeat protein n=1 Tax=Taibaiella lutea TaxID=2608001 RepID=A0A5M6CFH9_9BACT|nr:hypothetical protein [Taibaiella lutea]KAA5533807.1 hypothetical protein F0919_14860 [Taibaiella lutea]